MHSNNISIFTVAIRLIKGLTKILREASTNNHHLAIPPHPKQGLDIDPLDYNDSISLHSHFLHSSHLGFCHPWLIPILQMDFLVHKREHQYRRYESTDFLFHEK